LPNGQPRGKKDPRDFADHQAKRDTEKDPPRQTPERLGRESNASIRERKKWNNGQRDDAIEGVLDAQERRLNA